MTRARRPNGFRMRQRVERDLVGQAERLGNGDGQRRAHADSLIHWHIRWAAFYDQVHKIAYTQAVSFRAIVAAMVKSTSRVNVILDAEHATKLSLLAERTHTNPGTIARSLLSSALDEADPNPRNVTDLLDRIDGAFERAQLGQDEMHRGLGTRLENL